MTVMTDAVAVLESLNFETGVIETQPNFHAISAMQNNIRAYFVWRESNDALHDFTFQIARVWEVDTAKPLGAYPNLTDGIAAARMASATT